MFQFWKFATAGVICGSLLLGDPVLANSIKQGYRVSLLGVDVYEVTLAINLKQNSYAAQLGLEAAPTLMPVFGPNSCLIAQGQ